MKKIIYIVMAFLLAFLQGDSILKDYSSLIVQGTANNVEPTNTLANENDIINLVLDGKGFWFKNVDGTDISEVAETTIFFENTCTLKIASTLEVTLGTHTFLNDVFTLEDTEHLIWKWGPENTLLVVDAYETLDLPDTTLDLCRNENGKLDGLLPGLLRQISYDQYTLPKGWDTAVDRVTNNIHTQLKTCSKNTTVVPFITDTHWDENYKLSPMILRKLDKEFSFPIILHGGDLIVDATGKLTTEDELSSLINQAIDGFGYLNNKILYAVGNHELLELTQRDTPVYMSHNRLQKLLYSRNKNVVLGKTRSGAGPNTKALYGYQDDLQAKIRYITLNPYDSWNGTNYGHGNYGFSQKQLEWLGTALNVPTNEWHVVVLLHQIYDNTEYDINGIKNMEVMLTLLKKAQDGTAYSITTGGSSPYKLADMNVSFIDPINIIGIFCGHIHADTLQTIEDFIPTINSDIHVVTTYYDRLKYARNQCFDVLVIDKDNRTVNLNRVGVGKNRTFSY